MSAIMEHVSAPLGFDRRLRGMTRHRSHRLHTSLVLIERIVWELQHRPFPTYIRECGMHTTYPPRTP